MATLDAARRAKAILVERYGGEVTVVGIGVGRADINDDNGYGTDVQLTKPGLDIPLVIGDVPVRVRIVGDLPPLAERNSWNRTTNRQSGKPESIGAD